MSRRVMFLPVSPTIKQAADKTKKKKKKKSPCGYSEAALLYVLA